LYKIQLSGYTRYRWQRCCTYLLWLKQQNRKYQDYKTFQAYLQRNKKKCERKKNEEKELFVFSGKKEIVGLS